MASIRNLTVATAATGLALTVAVPAITAHATPRPTPDQLARETLLDSCATVPAKQRNLYHGAARFGARELCRESVREARSLGAAEAITWAFHQLGTPYSMAARSSNGHFDCSSLVYRSWLSAGVNGFFTQSPNTARYADKNAWKDTLSVTARPEPGDIRIMWRSGGIGSSSGSAGHAQIVIARGFVIQSGGAGDSQVNVADRAHWGGWKDRYFKVRAA